MRELIHAVLLAGFATWAIVARNRGKYGDAHHAMLWVIALLISWGPKL